MKQQRLLVSEISPSRNSVRGGTNVKAVWLGTENVETLHRRALWESYMNGKKGDCRSFGNESRMCSFRFLVGVCRIVAGSSCSPLREVWSAWSGSAVAISPNLSSQLVRGEKTQRKDVKNSFSAARWDADILFSPGILMDGLSLGGIPILQTGE